MTNEKLLEKVLAITIERFAKQATTYETEIANLNAQVIVLSSQIEILNKKAEEKPAKVTPIKES